MSTSAGHSGRNDDRDKMNKPAMDTGNGVYSNDSERAGNDRRSVVDREKEQFGGMKFGSAFFGWLTATGLTVVLAALLSAIIAGIAGTNDDAADQATQNLAATGITGVIALLVVLFVAYFAGGYVAGRMARFSGIKQGVAVWLWAVIIAIVLAIIGAIAGAQFNVLSQIGTLPTIPLEEGQAATGGIIALIAVVVLTLVGAILGGLTGMRYHRKVDRAGFAD